MNLMAVFAHPDDELGCVGTLAKHAARGDQVMLVWTTHGELASQFGDAGHTQRCGACGKSTARGSPRSSARTTTFSIWATRA